MDELKENIRKAETEKCKAEGVIECMRDGNVNVEEWMQDIESMTTTLDIPRSGSANSVRTDTSGVSTELFSLPPLLLLRLLCG